MKRFQIPEYKIPRNGEWFIWEDSQLAEMEKTDPKQYEDWDEYIWSYQRNPLAHFLPHGKKAGRDNNEGREALNDWYHDLILMLGPNQTGKSVIGMAFAALHGLIPCAKSWPVFEKHGIEYHEWTGPKIAIVSSWSWDNTEIVWEVYRRFLPRKELGGYAPNWGCFPDEKGKAKEVSFRAPTAKTVRLMCGSVIIFLCYTQQQIHWEGKQCDLAHCDEQPPEDKMDGLMARQLTRGKYTPIIMTLTGHILPSRPDTGAQGWIKTKMIDQNLTKGRKFKEYHLTVKDTPDAIMSPKQKEEAYIRNVVEPERTHNVLKINEGIARYWGGWQVGGGSILSEFNPDLHVIEPFDWKQYQPTLYRMIDHGQNPCAALVFAKMPWGDTLVLKEYYEFGRSISENCKLITEGVCGNRRRFLTEEHEQGMTYEIYEEIPSAMDFFATEMDARSFNTRSNESGQKIGALYNRFGCRVTPARAVHDFMKDTTPLIKELFAQQATKTHLNVRLGRPFRHPLLKYGAPSIYLLGHMPNLEMEIAGWVEMLGKQMRPQNKNDHLISCLGFYAGRDRPYMGVIHKEDAEWHAKKGAWRI